MNDRAKWPAWAVSGVVVLAVGGALGWAASAVFASPGDVLAPTKSTFATLTEGEVSSSITLNAIAKWDPEPVGTNLAAGTVTSVSAAAGNEVGAGAVLYSVDLRPVVVAEGDVPAFRTLARDSVGADAAQLQAFLAELGFYEGAVDGDLGVESERAIEQWQESLGIEATGVVNRGDLVFVPHLPGRVVIDEEIVFRGATLAGGESVVSGLAAAPSFSIPATPTQAALMPEGTTVLITFQDTKWPAVVSGQAPSADGNQVDVSLEGIDGAPICADSCALLPATGQNLLTSEIVLQEPVSGIIAPTAALLTKADGTINVIDDEGRTHPVTVTANAQGMSVIDGAKAGMRVQVPVSEDTQE